MSECDMSLEYAREAIPHQGKFFVSFQGNNQE